ncbi:MAG TPA: FadR/GntR family transcriptional regulator [Egicoccus sp.]|nr:FadR/GntR family transcriptional regulator [Egicoccus sp.]HSK23034.1 FadR/GntR family transcriptional regulator [Egicoccus sp.]
MVGARTPDAGRNRRAARMDPLASIGPLPVTRRADLVVARIRELILDESLAVGDRLPSERMLADQFGTSRAIVSQALRTLSLMGLVEIRPGSGAYVTRNPAAMMNSSLDLLVSTQDGDPEEIAELRYWLETVGATRALARITDEDLDELSRLLEVMDDKRGRLSSWVVADRDFHAALVGAAGNGYLATLYESVHAAVTKATYDAWVARDRAPSWFSRDFAGQMDLHRAILEGMRTRDEEQLVRALDAHQHALIDHLRNRGT